MGDVPLHRLLLDAARQDVLAAAALHASPGIDDSTIGLHVQQAVEKALKAVLSASDVAFRRTHDIVELLDVLCDAGLPAPPHADVLDTFNPFAVAARYGVPIGSRLDRQQALRIVEDVWTWAERLLPRAAGDT
jgi:HEPN domain-containing protein